MRVLVTGGSGFLGSHVVEALGRRGHEAVCLVRKTSDTSFLKEKGVEFSDDISEHPWGKIVPFKDPDGNDLQLYEAPNGG